MRFLESEVELLFVYGTLRPGGSPGDTAPRLRHPVGAASIVGVLYDLGAYPGAVLSRSDRTLAPADSPVIIGDLFAVSRSLLRVTDEYEGYDPGDESKSWYVRTRTFARLRDGSFRLCWIYEANLQRFPRAVRIASGDWIEHCRTKTEWPQDVWPD